MKIHKLGLIDYRTAEALQLETAEQVAKGEIEETLFFCSHPPCVTLGRSTQPEDLAGWSGDVYKVSRGGRATYHGPEQMIVYPILDLSPQRVGLRSKDLHHYLQLLSEVTCDVLREHYGLEATPKPANPELFGDDGLYFTGVWVRNQKLGSIGVAVKRWVSYHGLAINLYRDENAFRGLVPCGFQNNVMTHLEDILGYKVNRDEFEGHWATVFKGRTVTRS